MSQRYLFGNWVEAKGALTVSEVESLLDSAEQSREALAAYPMDKTLRVVGRLREKWRSPHAPAVREALEKLPLETGFSRKMIEIGLEELVWVLDPNRLERKLKTELRGIPKSPDCLHQSGLSTALSWSPIGTVLHVLSGNVFSVGVGSMLEGFLTGNVSILKMSSGEKRFLPLILRTLQECDEEGVLSRSVAVIDYSSREKEVIQALKRRVDGIVVWGGEEAVRAYRDGLSARTRFIMFGPKLSAALVTADGYSQWGAKKIAETLAKEISIWDQNACTAPQVCFVEGRANARELVDALAEAMEREAETLPPGPADVNTAVEIQKVRGIAEVAEAKAEGMLRASAKGVKWTVILDTAVILEPSPLHRTIKIIPIRETAEFVREAKELRGYVQTVGIVAGGEEGIRLSHELGGAGAVRVVELGLMGGSEIDDPHDGRYDLPQLVNIVVTRLPSTLSKLHPVDAMPKAAREEIINMRLRRLIDHAKESPFYEKRLHGAEISTIADLKKIPRLTRTQMDANMPQSSSGLKTSALFGGYISRSGGSTGDPKFSYYDAHDWEQLISHAVRVLEGAGLEKGDRVANCFLAGDLYGSFVSFDHINCRVGATTFAFAGTVSAQKLVQMWQKFRINVIEAVPSILVPLLREAKAIEPELRIEKVLYAGTPLSTSDREWIIKHIGAKRVSSIIGANDGGQIAFQCGELSGSFHHLVDDFNYVEIVDDHGTSVPDGEPGRILITSLLKFAFPLIRYEIGDAGRIVREPCRCGRTSRVIEYLGRADNILCVASSNVDVNDLAKVANEFPISAVQVVARNEDGREYLVFRVESVECDKARLRDDVYARLCERIPALVERMEEKSLARLDVEVVDSGALPRNPISGKVKLVVDERT